MTARVRRPGGDEDRLAAFEALRPQLLGVAYRILGSVTDAEDVLQDAWLRWERADLGDVANPDAYLTTGVGRVALDHLRRAKARRETYPGSWLPEPVAERADPAWDPEAAAELADSLSMALLVVLETLSPLERAAFVLREVFERSYPEVASTLGRTEAAVRQLVHRARDRVDEGHARFRADAETHRRLVERFLEACETAELDRIMDLLAPDVVMVSDGGGLARAPRLPVHGRDDVARLLVGISGRTEPDLVFTLEHFNGALGVVARAGTTVVSALALTTSEGVVTSLQLIANPDKLVSLDDPGIGLV
jgi:RNA polymerase sigma-70 factor (ECF subfamily)